MLKHKSLTCDMQERGNQVGSLKFDWQHESPIGPDCKLEGLGHGFQIKRSVPMREVLAKIVQVFFPNFAQDSSAINDQKHQTRLIRVDGIGNPNHLIGFER